MIIFKKALPRRTFLRGVGVTLALPLLDAMIPDLPVALCSFRIGVRVRLPRGMPVIPENEDQAVNTAKSPTSTECWGYDCPGISKYSRGIACRGCDAPTFGLPNANQSSPKFCLTPWCCSGAASSLPGSSRLILCGMS